jgi:hypothetical protein
MMTADFYSERQWHSTGMYTDCLGLAGFEKSLIIPLPGPPGTARRLVFFRGPGRNFSIVCALLAMAAFVVAFLSRRRARRAEIRQIVQEELRKGDRR